MAYEIRCYKSTPISFQRQKACPILGDCSEGFIWSITPSLSPQFRVAGTAQHQKMPTNWILRDKLYSRCCTERPALPRPIADKRWKLLKGSRVSFTRPKTGSRS